LIFFLSSSIKIYNKATGFISSDNNESIIYQENSIERLQLVRNTLMNNKPVQIQLDKNLKIFQPTKQQSSIPPVQLLPQDPLFPSNDRLSYLFDFLRSKCLVHNFLLFTLTSNVDRRVYSSEDEQSMTFFQCDLVLTTLLSFQWNERALREIKEQTPDFPADIYIKFEILINANRL
jgi:hypothetical protein